MRAASLAAVLILGALYLLVGMVFGELAGQAASHQLLVAWRWAAWVVSAIAFGAHIVYEQVRLRSSPRITALHVSSAAGLGAFGLAVAANLMRRRFRRSNIPCSSSCRSRSGPS